MRARHATLTFLAFAVAATPVLAGSVPSPRGHWGAENAFRLQIGEFDPRGDSNYWRDTAIERPS